MASSDSKPVILADMATRGEELQIDALPYVDEEIEEPGMRERVDQLILEEMASFQPPDYLQQLPAPSLTSTPLVETEMARIMSHKKLQVPDYIAAFETVKPPADADEASVEAWEASIARAQIALEAQTMKSINLELMSRYGVDAWKAHTEGMDKMHAAMKARVAALQSKIDVVNATRKSRQDLAGSKLKTLTRKWKDTVETNLQVELACHDAKREVKRLRTAAKEAGLVE